MKEIPPLVSVIVPTYNSERTLELCLKSIRNQTYKKIEILVVDGKSIDNTTKIAEKLNAKILKLDKRGRSYQRNIGILHARGELILFIDSDEVVPPTLLEECVNKIITEKLEAILIPIIDWGWTYIGRSRCLGNIINLIFKSGTKIPNSTIRFCYKYVAKKVGGYDTDLVVGEDVIFEQKCIYHKFKIGRCKSFIVHFSSENLRDIFLKKYVYGKTFRRYRRKAKKYNILTLEEYLFVGSFYIKHFYKLRRFLTYFPGFILVKTIEFLGLILGYFFSLI